ncbi:mitotic-spindle organizing protein 1-like [Anopheles ziemanni]|uniref:mitotic-spindle organizing protein 1-like n=1 Tax=Anopheles coustani TaxID=139045 RepID=UPI00265B60AC|nr:mitotic-spindle organizing protein 1-like [Anopheles coustani]XP_058166802.1 mitotic-spindle organizing protein 1-like [Anopheles ziemanni]
MPEPNSNEGNNTNQYMRLQQSQLIRANIQNISQFLNTGLSPETLDICIKLLEAGVHPQALSEVVVQIRNQVAAINNGATEE